MSLQGYKYLFTVADFYIQSKGCVDLLSIFISMGKSNPEALRVAL